MAVITFIFAWLYFVFMALNCGIPSLCCFYVGYASHSSCWLYFRFLFFLNYQTFHILFFIFLFSDTLGCIFAWEVQYKYKLLLLFLIKNTASTTTTGTLTTKKFVSPSHKVNVVVTLDGVASLWSTQASANCIHTTCVCFSSNSSTDTMNYRVGNGRY